VYGLRPDQGEIGTSTDGPVFLLIFAFSRSRHWAGEAAIGAWWRRRCFGANGKAVRRRCCMLPPMTANGCIYVFCFLYILFTNGLDQQSQRPSSPYDAKEPAIGVLPFIVSARHIDGKC
jgi:hypothetical protein